MDFENRIGTDFDNVSQRLVYNYIATQSDFRLQFRTQFESRYYRQILYTFVEDKATFKALLRQLDTLPEPLQDLVYKFTGECRAPELRLELVRRSQAGVVKPGECMAKQFGRVSVLRTG